jgi:cell wall-associated NlpC family hydrolase
MLRLIKRAVVLTLAMAVLFTGGLVNESYAHHRTGDMDAVSLSKLLIGEDYQANGNSPSEGFDAEGLVYYIFNKIGYDVPSTLDSQYRMDEPLIRNLSDLKYGDVLFFGSRGNPTFAGVYVGDRKFVMASKSSDEVSKRYLSDYYRDRFIGARRVLSKDDHLRAKIIIKARNYLGTPYVFGAKYGQTRTFDCSSFTKTVFDKNGIYLPRVSRDQAKQGTWVSKKNLKAGDLVFFSTPPRENRKGFDRIGHVGIYTGNGKMIHTYGDGGVKYTSIYSDWWKDRYITARRIIQ